MREPFAPREASSLEEVFGERGRLGNLAEKAYQSRLDKHAKYVAEKYGSEFEYLICTSLGIPRKAGGKKYVSDVDIAIANGDEVLLIDVKEWLPGIYISFPFLPKSSVRLLGRYQYSDWAQQFSRKCLGKWIGIRVGYEPGDNRVPRSRYNPLAWLHPYVEDKFILGMNMQMATERYKEALQGSGVVVHSFVVFVRNPRNSGEHHVKAFMWPGRIPSISEKWSFDRIEDIHGAPAPVNLKTTQLLRQMQRSNQNEER